ncbi:carboxylating nicotinate-nucleotide diphosphorylase [Tessaracoccus sp. MC1756]|uniref:carboxylating nicotinate-nucleotide diphosphorylase n=1 Tax=Tessaracoccus sp. MC1756 TaxID=2760311 RepID=UPI001600F005|nr:carboxylating nicotinate-nucleotide diphosphorylase [Tessaracoccus sp. MC1756]MBB1508234.1 carboxylating nicotinate-nucleotide diphosphorylase [Tessaracoccus sp. MC1756]
MTTLQETTTEARAELQRLVDIALDEDLRYGPDVTTLTTVPAEAQGVAEVVSREAGVISGINAALAALKTLADRVGSSASAEVVAPDGTHVAPGDVVLRISGPVQTLLTAERTLLNFLGQLSGVATATSRWVEAVAGTAAQIRDTRKTVPGLRALQKAAVVDGGGVNHRMALGDAALIKDNHVAAAGSVEAAFRAVQRAAPGISVEVECDTLEQVRAAVEVGAELVLLDNMAPDTMRAAVEICRPAGVKTEASGGLTLESAHAVAATGVDYISIGALTHSARVLDLGLDLRTTTA